MKWNTAPFQSCWYVCRRLDDEDKENMMPDSLALQEFHSKKTSIGKSRRLSSFYTSLFSNQCRPNSAVVGFLRWAKSKRLLWFVFLFFILVFKRLFFTLIWTFSSSGILVWMRACLVFVRDSVRIEAWSEQLP